MSEWIAQAVLVGVTLWFVGLLIAALAGLRRLGESLVLACGIAVMLCGPVLVWMVVAVPAPLAIDFVVLVCAALAVFFGALIVASAWRRLRHAP